MIRNPHGFVLLTLAAASWWLPTSPQARAMDIVVDGRPACTIVIGDKSPPVVRFAAEELQHHLEVAAGAILPITPESEAPESGNRIVLGRCKAADAAGITPEGLAPNGFRAKVAGDIFYIVGRDNWAFSSVDARGVSIGKIRHTGTLFGVYTFLKEKMGVTWLWPGRLGEVIPKRATIRIESWDRNWKPPLRHARLRTHYGPVRTEGGWANQKNLQQFRIDQTAWMMRHRMGNDVSLEYNHAWGYYLKRYKDSHPQFFALMPNGERGLDPHYTNYYPMCVSDPSFHDHIIEQWKERRTAATPWVNACENDSSGKCICEPCRSWDVAAPGDEVSMEKLYDHFNNQGNGWAKWMGSLTDRYCRFYLTLQEEARKIDPDATVIALAYENYAKPPVKAKLNRNIVISVVPGMMFPWTDEGRRQFRTQWQGWADAGASLYLRPNYALDGHNFPIFYAHKFGEDFAFAFERGMIATDFDSLTGQYATQGPNLYMMVRMQVDGTTPVEQILDDFYGGFGPAADAVRAYFDHWKQVSDAVTQSGPWHTFYPSAPAIFTAPVMQRGDALLAAAEQAADGDEAAARKVDFLRTGLTDVMLTLEAQAAHVEFKKSGNSEQLVSALTALDRFRAAHEHKWYSNVGYTAWAENRTWDRSLVKEARPENKPLPKTWKFQWDPEDEGVAGKWFADDLAEAGWLDIAVGSAWERQPVGLKWKAEHGTDYNGFAWYRNRFVADAPSKNTKLILRFGAVDEACTVWVNGKRVLERPFPYQGDSNSWEKPFEIDVSDVVRHDRPNTVAVRVEDNRGNGGIWRSVYLAERGP
jgi:hypothetical protein